jgi:2'-5' RNA ligase
MCGREAEHQHGVCGGRITRTASIHLTLVFIGDLPRQALPDVQAAAATVHVPRFDILFDVADCWRHNKIAYLAPSRPPEELLHLVENLEAVLAAAHIAFDRRAYKPHVTLLRRAACPATARTALLEPIHWPAREFVLIESTLGPDGSDYAFRMRFELS